MATPRGRLASFSRYPVKLPDPIPKLGKLCDALVRATTLRVVVASYQERERSRSVTFHVPVRDAIQAIVKTIGSVCHIILSLA
jgi:hypothetical protein